jgi:multisubunit Na+/H+ antiporter MnhF subunit
VNPWLLAAAFLIAGIGLCLIMTIGASPVVRLVALELAGILTAMTLLLLAQGLDRTILFDLALAVALLSLAAGLVFTHFLERWL